MTVNADDDLDLMARHVAGDRDAFAQLVTRHRDTLWAVAIRTLGDREDAADALQDALLSAYRAASNFRGSSAVSTWLYRIVVNACVDLARRRASRPTVPLTGHPEPAIDGSIGAADADRAVMAMLDELSEEQAAAVVLVDIEGFSVAETAEILDVPIGTVKSRCARGRARLAAILGNADAAASVSLPGATPEDNA